MKTNTDWVEKGQGEGRMRQAKWDKLSINVYQTGTVTVQGVSAKARGAELEKEMGKQK